MDLFTFHERKFMKNMKIIKEFYRKTHLIVIIIIIWQIKKEEIYHFHLNFGVDEAVGMSFYIQLLFT